MNQTGRSVWDHLTTEQQTALRRLGDKQRAEWLALPVRVRMWRNFTSDLFKVKLFFQFDVRMYIALLMGYAIGIIAVASPRFRAHLETRERANAVKLAENQEELHRLMLKLVTHIANKENRVQQ